MRPFLFSAFLLICIASKGQTFGQNLDVYSLDKVEISQANKALLQKVFSYLQSLPVKEYYSQELIDSIRNSPNLFTLVQVDSLKRNISNEEAVSLSKSDEPLLHLLGFWFLAQRQISQADIISIFKRIASISKKSPQLTFYCLCEPYAFDYFKTAELTPTPYLCFDMITHKYPVWSNCILVTGRYKRKAKRIIKHFDDRMQSEIVIVH